MTVLTTKYVTSSYKLSAHTVCQLCEGTQDELGVDGKIILKWIERMGMDFVGSIDVVLDEGKLRDFVKAVMSIQVP
jgi:hypothetical protein